MALASKQELGWLTRRRELLLFLLSVLLQLPLAYFLGHPFDQRIFLATGYVAGSGVDPYKPIMLFNVFNNPHLDGFVPVIGYPPPWPLFLGLTYRLSYGMVSNLFFYNFATKIPIIVANVVLAYFVRKTLLNLQVEKKKAQLAWLFVLFNPFTLLTTTGWGQIDSISAVLCVASLFELSKGESLNSGFLLGVSVAIKPVTAPLIPLPLMFSERFFSSKTLKYLASALAAIFALWFAPFFLLGWNMPRTLQDVNGRFGNAGGLTIFNLAEVIQGSTTIPSFLWFINYMWVPALLIGYFFVYRNPPHSSQELIYRSIGLMLIFFLSRAWLSEPNINVILPLILIAAGLGKISMRSLLLFVIIPLVFLVVNTTSFNIFFLVYPSVFDCIAQFDAQFGTIRYIARFFIAIVWSLIGWNLIAQMMKARENEKLTPLTSTV